MLRLMGRHAPGWVIIESAVAALISLASMLLIARAIGPDAAGTGAVALAALMLLDLGCASLFTDALVQRPRLEPRHGNSAVIAQVTVGLLAGMMLALAAPLLAAGAAMPQVTHLVWAVAPLLPISAFSGAVSGLVLRGQRFRLLAMRALLGLPASLLAGLVVAHAGGGAWAMVAQQVVATLVTFLVLLLGGRPRLHLSFSWGALGELWPVAGPQVLAVVMQVGRYRVFILALSLITAEAVVAVSNIAMRLLDAALAVVWGSISRISLPRLSALQTDRAKLAECYGAIAQLEALLGMAIASGVALTAPDLVRALMGPAWAEAAEAAHVVGWVAAISFCYGDATALFVAVGQARRNVVICAVSAVVPLLTLLLLRPTTPSGVAVCWAAGSLSLVPWVSWMVLRELRRTPAWLLRQILPAVLATLAMALAVTLLQNGPAAQWSAMPRLLASAVLGATVFGLVAWFALGRRMPGALRAHAAAMPAE